MLGLISILVGFDARAADDGDGVLAALRDGRAREAATQALGYTEEFSDVLLDVLRTPDLSAKRRRSIAEAALDVSPILAIRTFTDGREPTGWDAAYATLLGDADGGEDEGLVVALRTIERTLSPEVWRVEDGLEHLEGLVAHQADEMLVAQVVVRCADRLAPFDEHRERMRGIVDGIDTHELSAPARHLYAVAALRLRAADARRRWSSWDAELWRAAESTAPSPLSTELCHLAGERERVLRSTDADAHETLRELFDWSVKTRRSASARRMTLPWIARRHAEHGEASEMLATLDALAELDSDPLLLAAARCAAVVALADHGDAPPKPVAERVVAMLEDSAKRLEGTQNAVLVSSALARMLAVLGNESDSLEQLRAAAELARGGAPVEPLRIARTEWWQVLDPPVDNDLRPVETSRSACWQLADRAFRAEHWDLALEYLAVPPPGEGCGNAFDDARALQFTRRAECLEHLDRLPEARETRRAFLLEAVTWRSGSVAVVDLVEFERRHGQLAAHEEWIVDSGLRPETLEKALAYLAVRRAIDGGREDAAKAAARDVAKRWPEDSVLRQRIREILPMPTAADPSDGLGPSPPR